MRVVSVDRHTRKGNSNRRERVRNEERKISFSWWQDSHSPPPQSLWLQATLSDLDEKTKVMLSIIDQNDGDSFARRAEMFYMRRPELMGTIPDLPRSYGSLVRRYKQLASPVLNVENDSSSSSAAAENGRVSEEIADTRLRVLKLTEGKLYEQAELMRTNNDNREAILLFCKRVQRLVDRHTDLNAFLLSPASTSPL